VAEVREILTDIVAEDRRAGEVIQRLRALFKRGEGVLVPLSLNDVMTEVLHLTNAELIERGVTVVRDLAADLPQIRGDRVQLQQVVLNLILNGADAMSADAPGSRRLHVATARHNDAVRASVRDEGCGVPADAERIFEPFFTTKPQGLGLGLAICRSVIDAHQGRLWAEPHPERGAIFYLEMPAMPSRPT
jgi:C4-dicarboxylate-specific signal transduction histidine kinase